jgi:hypothetical protein
VLLFSACAFQMPAGFREEDVVERRLVDLEVRNVQAFGVERAHDFRQVSVRGRELNRHAAR